MSPNRPAFPKPFKVLLPLMLFVSVAHMMETDDWPLELLIVPILLLSMTLPVLVMGLLALKQKREEQGSDPAPHDDDR